MKNSFLHTILLFLTIVMAQAQVKGNKTIETRTFDIEDVETVKLNFYANVTIVQDTTSYLTITTDTNVFDLIKKDVVDKVLHLDQKEWISPSKKAVIHIGVPDLKRVETGTHDKTNIVLNGRKFKLIAPIGKVRLTGRADDLQIEAKLAKIDASELQVKNAEVNLVGWGNVKVNPMDQLSGTISKSGRLISDSNPTVNEIRLEDGGRYLSPEEALRPEDKSARFIRFKIRNNSSNRNHFVVIGPKPDGSKFSYGFPMMPYTVRKENWTVGTKVYKKNKVGLKELLVTISKDDENRTVNLFE